LENLYVLFCASSNTLELRQFLTEIANGEKLVELELFSAKANFSKSVAYSAFIECPSSIYMENVLNEVQLSAFSQHIDSFIIRKNSAKSTKIEQVFFDMDSTLIDMEVIVALAEHAGTSKEVSEITERAMNGELNFSESLIKRVSTLKGLPKSVIDDVQNSLPLNIGAELLAEYMRVCAIDGYILSGGFTYFTEVLVSKLQFKSSKANELVISNEGFLTGEVKGEIVDAQAKADFVLSKRINPEVANNMVVGDGANDLKMMATTPYSVAYKAKKIVNDKASYKIKNTGLDAIIYLLMMLNK
jgi:phosphoserine phosphatase